LVPDHLAELMDALPQYELACRLRSLLPPAETVAFPSTEIRVSGVDCDTDDTGLSFN
jgi:hypothetical protein